MFLNYYYQDRLCMKFSKLWSGMEANQYFLYVTTIYIKNPDKSLDTSCILSTQCPPEAKHSTRTATKSWETKIYTIRTVGGWLGRKLPIKFIGGRGPPIIVISCLLMATRSWSEEVWESGDTRDGERKWEASTWHVYPCLGVQDAALGLWSS